MNSETRVSDRLANRNPLWLLQTAGLLGAVGVLMGAFSAHGLEDWLLDRGLEEEVVLRRVEQANTAVRYHLVHAVVLLGLFAASSKLRPGWLKVSGVLFLVGIVLFSGSLYALVALNLPVMGAITPLGGVAWIIAWISLAFSAAKTSSDG